MIIIISDQQGTSFRYEFIVVGNFLIKKIEIMKDFLDTSLFRERL